MKPKAVIFDLDGTLIDFHTDYLLTQAEKIFPELGVSHLTLPDIEEYFRSFNFFGFIEEHKREDFTKEFWSYFDWESFPSAVPIEGSLETLQHLKELGKQLAIATARLSTPEKVRSMIHHTGFLDHVDHLDCRQSEDTHWADKRELLVSVTDTLGVRPEECIMVGDIPPDIESAKDVGFMATIAVLTGGLKPEVFSEVKPDKLIKSVSEIKHIVK